MRIPPPAIVFVGAVMNSLDFTELKCVDGQTDVTIAGEPFAMVLIMSFVAVTLRSFTCSKVDFITSEKSTSLAGVELSLRGTPAS